MAKLGKTHITCRLFAKVKGKFNERAIKLRLCHKQEEIIQLTEGVEAGQRQSKSG